MASITLGEPGLIGCSHTATCRVANVTARLHRKLHNLFITTRWWRWMMKPFGVLMKDFNAEREQSWRALFLFPLSARPSGWSPKPAGPALTEGPPRCRT